MLRFFDLGMNVGACTAKFIGIAEELGMRYEVDGFEPIPELSKLCAKLFDDDPRVRVHNMAIGGHCGAAWIHRTPHPDGHSLFASKPNADPVGHACLVTRFSEWMIQNVPLDDFKILKVNIEGGEYHLFRDLCETGTIRHFQIICGAGDDVAKIPELADRLDEHNQRLADHGIVIHPFSARPTDCDLKRLIQEALCASAS